MEEVLNLYSKLKVANEGLESWKKIADAEFAKLHPLCKDSPELQKEGKYQIGDLLAAIVNRLKAENENLKVSLKATQEELDDLKTMPSQREEMANALENCHSSRK